MRSEVRIGLQSLSYGFLNEIMNYSCLEGGPESDKIGYTKFNEGCAKFCKRCVKSLRWGLASCYVRSR